MPEFAVSSNAMLLRRSGPRTATKITRQQQLASRPVRLVSKPIVDGKLTVSLEQKSWSSWFLRLPPNATKTFEFDSLGQLVWSLCDGKNSVQQIAKTLARTYNLSQREAQLSTEKFLTTLTRKGLIAATITT